MKVSFLDFMLVVMKENIIGRITNILTKIGFVWELLTVELMVVQYSKQIDRDKKWMAYLYKTVKCGL